METLNDVICEHCPIYFKVKIVKIENDVRSVLFKSNYVMFFQMIFFGMHYGLSLFVLMLGWNFNRIWQMSKFDLSKNFVNDVRKFSYYSYYLWVYIWGSCVLIFKYLNFWSTRINLQAIQKCVVLTSSLLRVTCVLIGPF